MANLPAPANWWCPSKDTAGYQTTTLYDLEGSDDGTLTNMETGDWRHDIRAGGRFALDFDGADEYVDIAGATGHIPATADWTLSVWFDSNGVTGGETIFSQYFASVGNGRFLLRRSDSDTSQIAIFLGNQGVHSSVAFEYGVIDNSKWNHTVIRRMGDTFDCWLNDRKSTHTDTSDTRSILQNTNYIGAFPGPNGLFNGRIDDCRLWTSALTDAQIAGITQRTTETYGRVSVARQTRLNTYLVPVAPPPSDGGYQVIHEYYRRLLGSN